MIAASIVFFLLLSRLSVFIAAIRHVLGILAPVTYGLVFAYLLSKLSSFFESKLLARAAWLRRGDPSRASRSLRALGILLSMTCLLLFIGGTMAVVIPQIYTSIQRLIQRLPDYYGAVTALAMQFLSDNPGLEGAVVKLFGSITDNLAAWLQENLLAQTNQIIANITSGVFSVVKELFSIVVGLIVSVYVLYHKEKLAAQIKRLLYGAFSPRLANSVLKNARFLDRTVGGFVLGKLIESLIVGAVTYVFLIAFGMPYSVLIAVLIGLTNIIPFFGPFIGTVPSALMILLEDPVKCLVFLIFIIILHTLAGNVLSPRIQGETIGLGSFWVLLSILIFGGLFGFWGLLLGAPVFTVIYAAVANFNASRLSAKKYPSKTEDYIGLAYIDPETLNPVYGTGERKSIKEGKKAREHGKKDDGSGPKGA